MSCRTELCKLSCSEDEQVVCQSPNQTASVWVIIIVHISALVHFHDKLDKKHNSEQDWFFHWFYSELSIHVPQSQIFPIDGREAEAQDAQASCYVKFTTV